ncbi:unnamed protein product [Cylindrotheca closterium]|uniref:Cyclic nucleotide-binding domain-containing protein n=1 Tax=Cylindrotheca closterium TaxID=2856 RepID=A0AAD2CEC3_9STRA|nr:unnamed protein product [Cylindrotheca closterium]
MKKCKSLLAFYALFYHAKALSFASPLTHGRTRSLLMVNGGTQQLWSETEEAALSEKLESDPSEESMMRGGEYSPSAWNNETDGSNMPMEGDAGSGSSPSTITSRTFDSDAEFLESVIKASNFGQGLDEGEDLQDIIQAFVKTNYSKGELLFSEKDETGDFLFVVESGQFIVSVEGQQLPAPYGIASQGSIIGELALIYDTGRVGTVRAKTDVTGFRLDRDAFLKWLEKWPGKRNDLKHELKQIDDVIAKVSGVRLKYGGSVIRKINPSRLWLWTRWSGTILQHAWKVSLANLLTATTLVVATRLLAKPTWGLTVMPDPNNPLISKMLGLFDVWQYLMTVTTFILTFFLGQAYSLWRDIYSTARVVQGRLSDINLMLAVSAERDRSGAYTKRARELMEDVASYTRLYHVFMWASFSNKLNLLLSDMGLRRMVNRGVLSRKQFNTLQKLDATTVAPQHACLIWIMTRFLKGMQDNVVPNDVTMKQTLFNKAMELQGTFAGVGGKLAGRSPLAYVHLVQILVDSFLLLAPVALTYKLGVWGIPAVGILTLFYSGLLDLSKILLHPLGNDDDIYDESVNMDLAVIIRESNGGSTRWMDGGELLPF